MKKIVCSLVSLLFATSAYAQTVVLTDGDKGIEKGNVTLSNKDFSIKTPFTIEQKVLHGGKQEGSKTITVTDKKGLTFSVIPSRGMNILKVEGNGTGMGWNSPVKEVVNPKYINLQSRNGLGWLEGFNEAMVRCGYEWTGHPVTVQDEVFSLHGRAGNTPASKVEIVVSNKAPYEIIIRGTLKETSFKKVDLQTVTELHYVLGSNQFTISDTLTNNADYAHEYEIIYHSNFGKPLLEEGAQFSAPMTEISAFNDYAKKGLSTWQTYLGPTKDFDEMVFNIKPIADNAGKTVAALINKAGTKGAAIEFNVNQLPSLTLWKNTDTIKQGYVTGIEPGTNYAYPVNVEREQGRVKQLQPGASAHFDLTYIFMSDANQVAKIKKRIADIQGSEKINEVAKPIAYE